MITGTVMFLLHCCVLFLPLHLRWRGRASSNLIIIYIQQIVIVGFLGGGFCRVYTLQHTPSASLVPLT